MFSCPGRIGAQNPDAGPVTYPGLNALTLTVALEGGIEKSRNEAWTFETRKSARRLCKVEMTMM